MKVYFGNTGGSIGMDVKGRPVRTAEQLLEGVSCPKGVELTLDDFNPKLDSKNIKDEDRTEIYAERLAEVYSEHDAFVLGHGTETEGKTGGALSMVYKRTFQKPGVVVGSLKKKKQRGNAVIKQLEDTLEVLKYFHDNSIVGWHAVSNGQALSASRLWKRTRTMEDYLVTPFRAPVAYIADHVHHTEVARLKEQKWVDIGLRLEKKFSRKVGVFIPDADINPRIMRLGIDDGLYDGIIIYGDNPSNRPWNDAHPHTHWLGAIKQAIDAGIHVALLSAYNGEQVDLESYQMSQMAADMGALTLESLTFDMASFKFRQALAMFPNDPPMIQKYISTNFVGELLSGIDPEWYESIQMAA